MSVTVGANQGIVAHKASSGMTVAFPDVCKTPGVAPPGVPIPYPNVAAAALAQKQTALKTGGTAAVRIGSVVKLEGKAVAMQLDAQLSNLHAQLRMLPARDPNQWQAILEQYVAAAAALYLLRRDDD